MAKQNQYHPQSIPHPGSVLVEKLEEMGMGPKEFALRTGKPEKTVTAVLKGDSAITADMAVLFENVTQIPAHFWMNYQRSYDEYIAREKRMSIIANSGEWAKLFPVKEMVKLGWLAPVDTLADKVNRLFSFFRVSSKEAWEDYYFHQELKVNFRISLSNISQPYAISCWLRQGEVQASMLTAKAYNETKFKNALPALKKIMATHPENFFSQLQSICLDAGVKVVHTPSLPKAPICGSTRWINDHPIIQLTGRYKRNDSFWFTFFHEAGHVLLHGKKEIFLENISSPDMDKEKESEADAFATKCVLSKEEEATIIAALPLDKKQILKFAKQFNTHPAIIVGRLQHNKLVPFSYGHEYIVPVVFE